MKIIESNEKILKQKIAELFSLEIGISIEILGSLYIKELDNGGYAVGGSMPPYPNPEDYYEWEEVFGELEEALNYFIKKRNYYGYGGDFGSIE